MNPLRKIFQALTPDHHETDTKARITAFILTAGGIVLLGNECYEAGAAYSLASIFYMAVNNEKIGAIAPLVRDQIERDEIIISHDDLDF